MRTRGAKWGIIMKEYSNTCEVNDRGKSIPTNVQKLF
jgi:hypothetical protein